jgi:hypothetical protein
MGASGSDFFKVSNKTAETYLSHSLFPLLLPLSLSLVLLAAASSSLLFLHRLLVGSEGQRRSLALMANCDPEPRRWHRQAPETQRQGGGSGQPPLRSVELNTSEGSRIYGQQQRIWANFKVVAPMRSGPMAASFRGAASPVHICLVVHPPAAPVCFVYSDTQVMIKRLHIRTGSSFTSMRCPTWLIFMI